ncbi:MAG: ABC transporter ATP-binding protein [Oligoflexia bacterium]|nr:ABC transporter ATP-binding protein [Oligoflexia bacterium]
MSNASSSALSLENLSYAYRSNWVLKRIHALTEVSLEIREGEAFGFLGHNGAGKTTAMKCILNLIRPAGGKISIFGRDSREPEARKVVGYLPEQPYFYDHLNVFELMELYAVLAGIRRAEAGPAIARALDLVKVSARKRSPMRSLSKGLTQRVAMAQAIVAQPKLLLLDEPFSGLDPIGRRDLRELLVELNRNGTTIFMSSHVLSDVEHICGRVSIMVQGKIKALLDIKELANRPTQHFEMLVRNYDRAAARLKALASSHDAGENVLILKFEQRARAEEALRLALAEGASVEAFHPADHGLEEIFVQVVQAGR